MMGTGPGAQGGSCSTCNHVASMRELYYAQHSARTSTAEPGADHCAVPGTGPAPRNKELSLERAQAVRGAVQAQLEQLSAGPPPLELSVQGHGEVLPMGCDDSAWGRQVNRRVEVWLR